VRARGLISTFAEIGALGPAAYRSDSSGIFFKQAEGQGELQKSGDRAGYLGLDDLGK
jgi:hypothetical protein